jgi:hypothetical protein
MMMKMNKKRKKSSMSMDKGMKLVKSTKKGMAGDDMLSMDTVPMMKKNGGAINQHKKMAMGKSIGMKKGGEACYADGGSVTGRGYGAARTQKTKIC